MAALLPAYQSGQLLIVHAAGSTDPARSHFDAQFFMEIGKPGDRNIVTGWLGATSRASRRCAPTRRCADSGFAFGLQQTLAGGPTRCRFPIRRTSAWRATRSTRTQRLTGSAPRISPNADPLRTAALNTQRTITTLSALNIGGYVPAGGAVYPGGGFGNALRSTAALIRADIGIEAVQIDSAAGTRTARRARSTAAWRS